MKEYWISNLELTGSLVRLEPLERTHRNKLLEAAADGRLWELWFTSVPSEATIDSYIETALDGRASGTMYPFVVIDKVSEKIIGSTRYLNISRENLRLEIGATWYAKSYQRSGVNTECKFLLLSHAFESLNCICVQFRTHWHNLASRRAIERLGAKMDGVLRNERISPDGSKRDTVVYSILDSEWPAVKQALSYFMSE